MNKHQNRIISILRIVPVVAALFILSACAHVQDASQEKNRIVKVGEGIYRGPRLDDLSELQSLKVRTILNLEDSSEAVQKESETARKLGITMISIPMSQIFRPRQSDLLLAVKTLEDRRLYPIYVHCLRGRDRTGFVIAAYKILHEGWTVEKAYEEAVENGHNTWFYDAILGWKECLLVIASAKADVRTIP